MAIDNNIPTFVERDPAVIMTESKAKLEELLGRELQPAQVEQLILNFVVFRETLLVNRFNAGMRQMLYQFSTAPILDYIAGLVAVERLPAASAGCTVRFTLVAGHGSVLIPEGTRVSSSDGLAIFRTIDDAIIAPATMTVELSVLADVAGKVGNGYAVGTINKILDPLAFVSTVENIDVTGGGSDVESDAQLRERIKLAPSQYSSAGSRSSYKFYAKSANAMITDVSVSSPVPGSVLIVPLTNEEETPAQVITDVYNVCNAENVRPLTDTVIGIGAGARGLCAHGGRGAVRRRRCRDRAGKYHQRLGRFCQGEAGKARFGHHTVAHCPSVPVVQRVRRYGRRAGRKPDHIGRTISKLHGNNRERNRI